MQLSPKPRHLLFSLAHLARCAAAILRRVASESRRGEREVPPPPLAMAEDVLFVFAHRAFWEAAILRRADWDTVRRDSVANFQLAEHRKGCIHVTEIIYQVPSFGA